VYRDQVLESLRSNVATDQIVIMYKLLYENKSTQGLGVIMMRMIMILFL
jgi:hypothetical protein